MPFYAAPRAITNPPQNVNAAHWARGSQTISNERRNIRHRRNVVCTLAFDQEPLLFRAVELPEIVLALVTHGAARVIIPHDPRRGRYQSGKREERKYSNPFHRQRNYGAGKMPAIRPL